MLNKWFWLELRWAAVVNAIATLVLSTLLLLLFVPPMIFALGFGLQIETMSFGLGTEIFLCSIAIAMILLLVNGLLLVGVNKSEGAFYLPWLLVNLIILLLLGDGIVRLVMHKNIDIASVVLLVLFTAYHAYSYITIYVHCWKLQIRHQSQTTLVEEPNELDSMATT